MAHPAVAQVESALRSRKLDGTLTSALPPFVRADEVSMRAATTIRPLDQSLHGGMPRGQLSEITGPRSAGRTTVLWQLLAAATQRGEIVACVDTCDRLDVTSVLPAGLDLARVLWIRGAAADGSATIERLVERALKAFSLVLQAGGFGVVAIDLVDVPTVVLKRLPFAAWMRLQRMIEGSDTAGVLLAAEPLARSAGGVSLALSGRVTGTGASPRSRLLEGIDITTRVSGARRHHMCDATVMARLPRR